MERLYSKEEDLAKSLFLSHGNSRAEIDWRRIFWLSSYGAFVFINNMNAVVETSLFNRAAHEFLR